jgi:LPXTG-site transpeptidase (sortase) family protein
VKKLMKYKSKQSSRLRRFNNLLSVLIALFAVYLVAWPFLPQLDYWWKTARHYNPPLAAAVIKSKSGEVKPPADNTLVIPSIHFQETIYDGYPYTALDKGVWHSSKSSTPDKGSNTVIAGHRFTYHGFQRGSAAFYNLDKLETGDQIVIFWHGIRYNYQVSRSFVVKPTEVSIENSTPMAQLTLYTCTPLWTSTNRLVVTAQLMTKEAS